MATLNANTRVDATDVKEIFDTELTDSELNVHINLAAERVDDIATTDDTVTDQRLALIERYLAAHHATVSDPREDSISHETFRAEYLRETSFGQSAIDLDPTDTLASTTTYVDLTTPDSKGIR